MQYSTGIDTRRVLFSAYLFDSRNILIAKSESGRPTLQSMGTEMVMSRLVTPVVPKTPIGPRILRASMIVRNGEALGVSIITAELSNTHYVENGHTA